MSAVQGPMNKTRPVFTYAMLIINVAVFLWLSLAGSTDDGAFMAAHGALLTQDIIIYKKYYELVTSMFLHFGIDHLASNMIILIAVGDPLERVIGTARTAVIYLVSGIAGNLLSVALELATASFAVSAGASGAILGLLGAVIYVLIRNHGRIGGLSLWRVVLSVVITFYIGLTGSGVNNAAHFGGLICGRALAVLLYHPSLHDPLK